MEETGGTTEAEDGSQLRGELFTQFKIQNGAINAGDGRNLKGYLNKRTETLLHVRFVLRLLKGLQLIRSYFFFPFRWDLESVL